MLGHGNNLLLRVCRENISFKGKLGIKLLTGFTSKKIGNKQRVVSNF